MTEKLYANYSTRKCPKCGNTRHTRRKYCPTCGTKLEYVLGQVGIW